MNLNPRPMELNRKSLVFFAVRRMVGLDEIIYYLSMEQPCINGSGTLKN